jgi:hypothetical protein
VDSDPPHRIIPEADPAPNGPAADPSSLEQRTARLTLLKLRGEIRAQRQDRVQKWIGMIALIAGSFGAIAALALDRIKAHEQRTLELADAARAQRVARMTAIANDYDTLVRATLSVLYRERATEALLGNQVQGLVETLKSIEYPTREERLALGQLDSILPTLTNQEFHITNIAEGFALQQSWRGRNLGPSPDFAVWFGDQLAQQWSDVLNAANEAMSESGSSFFQGNPTDTDKTLAFHKKANEFQRLLYQKIKEASLNP